MCRIQLFDVVFDVVQVNVKYVLYRYLRMSLRFNTIDTNFEFLKLLFINTLKQKVITGKFQKKMHVG